jgi:methylmalonyl-CoA mutase
MSEPDVALAAEFEPPSREAWLGLVAKVLKGGDFAKRLVSRTADGLSVQPLYTADTVPDAVAAGRSGWFPGGWDVRQCHVEPEPKAANKAILEDLEGGSTSLLLQILAPGQAGLSYSAAALSEALKGVHLNACTIPLDARENTLDAAGSLLDLARGQHQREHAPCAFNYDPLGVLAKTGTLYHRAD